MKAGLMFEKLGMTQCIDGEKMVPVTVLKVLKSKVLFHKTQEKHGYDAVVFGYGELTKENALKKLTKPLYIQMKKLGENYYTSMKEIRIDDGEFAPVGSDLDLSMFDGISVVDIEGTSKGKGFAGVMKKYNFGGGRATHGNSVSHRSHGSTGGRQDPGRVFKNKKMAGHMGDEHKTLQNIKIFSVDKERGLLLVRGSVTGSRGNLVFVRSAKKSK